MTEPPVHPGDPDTPLHEDEPPAAPAPDPEQLVRVGLLFYGAMAVIAVLWRSGFYGESIWLAEPAPREPWGALPAVGLGAGVGLAIVALSNIWTERSESGARVARALAEPLSGLSVPNALLLAMASGLAEEMLFRGALQPRTGLIVASLAFGAVHFVPRRELLPWTGFAIVAGLVFGWIFDVTGQLAAPVVAHTVVNGINLPLLVQRYGGPRAGSADPD